MNNRRDFLKALGIGTVSVSVLEDDEEPTQEWLNTRIIRDEAPCVNSSGIYGLEETIKNNIHMSTIEFTSCSGTYL